MPKTAVGLFENVGAAEQAADDLDVSVFPRSDVRVLREPLNMPLTGVASSPRTEFQAGLERELRAMGASDEEASVYVQKVRGGAVLVFANGSPEAVDTAAEIMRRHGAMNIEELSGREPSGDGTTDGSLPLVRDDVSIVQDNQTGRIRQSGEGVRMFVW